MQISRMLPPLTLMILAYCTVGVATSSSSSAHDYRHGDINIEHPWARATTPAASTGAVYMGISNRGTTADRLVSANTAAAGRVEFHDMKVDGDGIMRMRELDAGVVIPAEATADLEPGGQHIMLLDLGSGLTEGETFPLTLHFEHSDDLTVHVQIESVHGPGDEDETGHDEHGDRQ